jgi:CheY-like chemotaxis protein
MLAMTHAVCSSYAGCRRGLSLLAQTRLTLLTVVRKGSFGGVQCSNTAANGILALLEFQSRGAATHMNKPRILAVDDDQEVLNSLKEMLSSAFEVTLVDPHAAYSDALCKWNEDETLHLALVDLRIPNELGQMDPEVPDEAGYRLIRELRSRRADSGVFVYSAFREEINRKRASEEGADDLFLKSGDREKMIMRIMDFLRESDYSWAITNQELLAKYPGKCIAVFDRTTWGIGDNLEEAWHATESLQGHPSRTDTFFVVIPNNPWFPISDFANNSQTQARVA